MNFAEQFRQKVTESPTAMAIRFKDSALSYQQLATRIERLRSEFGSLKGMRVIILLPDSIEAYLFYLFLFLSEAVFVPLSVQLTRSRIQCVIDRIDPHLVVTNDLLYQAHAEVLSAVTCLQVGGASDASVCGFAWQMAGPMKSVQDIPRDREPNEESVRVILFTSGSTGTPKGVCLSESNLTAAAGMMVNFLPMDRTTRSLVTVPLYDYYGLIQVLGHILGGAGYIFGYSPAFAKQLHRVLQDENVTDLVLVPHTLRKLTEGTSQPGCDGIRSLRRITTSSDTLMEDVLRRAFQINPGLIVVNIYGLTEAGRACYRILDRNTPFSMSIGRPSQGVEVEIDGEKGEPGEIIIRGPNVMLGYFQGIVECRVGYLPCREMRTGDLGYFDSSGDIVLLGRRDQVINLMGAKIHPIEIEMAALKVEGVREAKAQLLRGPTGEPFIHLDVAVVGDHFSAEAIREALRKALPRMFVPATIRLVSEIARTELGAKILR